MNADILDDNAAEVQVGVNIQIPRSVEVVQDIEFGTLLVDSANMNGDETFLLDDTPFAAGVNLERAPNVESRGGEQVGRVCTSITQAEYAEYVLAQAGQAMLAGLSGSASGYNLEIAEESVTLRAEDAQSTLTFIPRSGAPFATELDTGYGQCWDIGGELEIPAGVEAGRYEGAINVNVIYGDDSGSGAGQLLLLG